MQPSSKEKLLKSDETNAQKKKTPEKEPDDSYEEDFEVFSSRKINFKSY